MALRFGIHTGQQYCEFEDLLKLWTRAEELGLDWASVFDHFIPIFAPPEGPCFEGLTTLAALAMATKKLRCGIIVAGVTYRNPVLLAKAAVTIDHISGGRMELGLGAAWHELEHQQYGFDFPSIGTRMDMLDEACAIIKTMFAEERTTYKGKHFQVEDALFVPRPVQKPDIPLWIGGGGEKRTLRAVARYANGWNYFMTTPEEYRQKLDALEGHCQDWGRDPASIRKQLITWAILDQDTEPPNERFFVGSSEQFVERLEPYLDMGVQDVLLLQRSLDAQTLESFAGKVAAKLR